MQLQAALDEARFIFGPRTHVFFIIVFSHHLQKATLCPAPDSLNP
jgi:hypothetical protein